MSQQQGRKLMDQVRDRIRIKHYSKSTESTYVHWILRYILFHNKRHPVQMGKPEIEAYLSHLAQNRNLSSSSQIYTHVMSKGNLAVRSPLDIFQPQADQCVGQASGLARAGVA